MVDDYGDFHDDDGDCWRSSRCPLNVVMQNAILNPLETMSKINPIEWKPNE